METKAKHHYRAVFKSDHLGSADLEEMLEDGKKLVFTITHGKQFDENNQTKVAGKLIAANIVYFKEGIKPLVINSTNGKVLSNFAGSKFVEDWNNILVELYIDPTVKMKGQVVGGVRIKPTQPKLTKPELTPDHARWQEAKKAISEGKKAGVLKVYNISPENLKLIESV